MSILDWLRRFLDPPAPTAPVVHESSAALPSPAAPVEPTQDLGALIREGARIAKLFPEVLEAIQRHETAHYTSRLWRGDEKTPPPWNPGGMQHHPELSDLHHVLPPYVATDGTKYAAFASAADGILGHGRFLARKHYAAARAARTPEAQVLAVAAAGYAEDPRWASKVLGILKDARTGRLTLPDLSMPSRVSAHFALAEVERSAVAQRLGVSNHLPAVLLPRAMRWAEVLEVIRAVDGQPMSLNGWYRCPAVNKEVGGAADSGHLAAEAVDLPRTAQNWRRIRDASPSLRDVYVRVEDDHYHVGANPGGGSVLTAWACSARQAWEV